MVYGYVRVSTDNKLTENQRFEIEKLHKIRGNIENRQVGR